MANEAPEALEGSDIPEPQASPPPPETIEVDTITVRCDGGGGVLGHPAVYLNMGEKTWVECPYCDRRFVLKAGASSH